ncbi:MAG: ABC transporter permease [Syntrophomonas sp.]
MFHRMNCKFLQKALFVLMLMMVWETLARTVFFNPTVFPSVTAILNAFAEGVASGLLIEKTAYSLLLIFKGLLISLLTAVLLSSMAIMSSLAENIVTTLNSILHPLPGIALLPVAILWFGIGEASIIFIVIHSVLWPMVVNFMTGFKTIPRIYMDVGKNIGLRPIGLLWGVILPASLPYLLSGTKIGWARAWRSVIAAEMVFGAASGTAGGLGWHIYMTRYLFDISGTFAALLAIIIVGILVEELLFNNIEKHTVIKWGMTL